MTKNAEGSLPPLQKDPMYFTPEETRAYFDLFLSMIPERIEVLESSLRAYYGVDSALLDRTPDSLIYVWRWFLANVKTVKTPPMVLRRIRNLYSDRPKEIADRMVDASRERFSSGTELMIRDIAMYLSEVFLKNDPSVYWTYYDKPKTDFFVNKPVLGGFADTAYEPPFKMFFEPVHMVGVQAAKVWDNSADENDLLKLYELWAGKVLKEE